MGVIEAPARPIPPGGEQDLLLRAATEEVQDKGFVVDYVGVGLEELDAQQPVMIGGLVLGRNAQPLVVRIE